MSDVAVRVDGLGKMFRIGGKQASYNTFRDTLADAVTAPFRRASRILRGQSYGASDLTETIWALKDVSFEVKHGEVLGIIGRNGAGKSTLLKILSRITEPTEGKAQIYGRVGALLEVGTGFHPELTGRENIFLNGAILGMSRTEINRKFDEIVAFAEVEKFIDTPVKHYSSGMGLRLGFAVAAHMEPEILIVDEVLAVGDAVFQKKCLGKMEEVAGEGRTVLFVSHNLLSMQSLCNKAMWLDAGKIIAVGNPPQIVNEYLTQGFQAKFERAWEDPKEAPGHETMKLRRIAICPEVEGTSEITIETPVRIEIDFFNFASQAYVYVALHVFTSEGILVFATGSYETGQHRQPIDIGGYRAICYIPANFFNSMFYSLTLSFVRNEGNLIFSFPDALQFELSEEPESRKIAYYGRWDGVIRPKFEWKVQSLSLYSDDTFRGK